MLKNYLKIAVRNLFKEKTFTLINVLSLAVGIGCFLFLLLLDQYAFNFDTFHQNADRIYRVNDQITTESGSELNAAITPWPWAPALAQRHPEVEDYVRFASRSHSVAARENEFNYSVTYVDNSFFDVFSFQLDEGDPDQALDGPNEVVLTSWIAQNLFGSEQAMGKEILLDGEPFEVSGIIEEIHPQSSIGFDLLASAENLNPSNFPNYDNWKSHSIYTYLLMKEGADISQVEAGFTSFLRQNADEDAVNRYRPWLQALPDIYLGGDLFSNHGETLDKSYIYIFTAIGFLILVISCVNFINISTARAAKRNVEVGIRKVVGARKRQLVFQYLFEVFLISLLSVGMSIVLVEWALPWFNAMTDWQVSANYMSNSFFVLSALGVIAFVTLVAGGYPAFYLSKFRPTQIFRARGSASGKSWLRTGLVVSQFTLAIFLLFSSRVVDRQLGFLQSRDLGYNEENVVIIVLPDGISHSEADAFQQELLRNPDIQNVSLASNGPFSSGSVYRYDVEESEFEEGVLLNTFYVDRQYISLLELDLLQGRNFDPQRASDSGSAYIINEKAAREFGWGPQNSIGKTIIDPASVEAGQRGEVIGVIKDFHFESLQREISPLVLRYRPEEFDHLLVRVSGDKLAASREQIQQRWDALFPGQSFYSYYLEDNLAGVYELERIIGNLLSMLTYLTIFIACLGLLGLASYSTIQRTKEIGIRKVMGATAAEIVSMLSLDFMRYVAIALAIGIPLAWLGVDQWLQNFAYHTSVGMSTVLFTLGASIGVALLTVGWQAFRAATANPVDSLRTE